MKEIYIYIHGKGGSYKEAETFKQILKADVVGVDYDIKEPWLVKEELREKVRSLADGYDRVNIIANSIGAYLTMVSLSDFDFYKVFFVSPIVDMEKLIKKMMMWVSVSEDDLEKEHYIETNFGETLSWEYLCYVRNNPVKWNKETYILYGENDNLTDIETIKNFAGKVDAKLRIMKNGEHWFHTDKQIEFMLNWIKDCVE